MKVKNLKAKLFVIPVKGGEGFNLKPASGTVELPDGYDKAYVNQLAKVGHIAIVEQDEELEDKAYTFEELDEMHYTQVNKIAESLGLEEGKKDETIALILEAQEG